MVVWRAIATSALLVVITPAAWAQTSPTLPAPQVGVNAQIYSGGLGPVLDSQSYQGSGLPVIVTAGAGGSSAQGSVTTGTGQPLVSFSATAAPGMSAGAGAELLYEFALLGPANYAAPINVSLTGQYMFTGGAADINQGVGLVVQCYPATCGTFVNLARMFDNVGDGQVHNYALNFQIYAQQTYLIDMGGYIQVNNGRGNTDKTVSAWIDPVISYSLNDATVDPSAFHLAYSDGVFSAAEPGGVPEPATWAMMLIGFIGVGVLLRRRNLGLSRVTNAAV